MAYSEELLQGCIIPTSAVSSTQSLASAADILVYNVGEQITLSRIMFQVTTAAVGSPVVSVYARPTYGSTSGQLLIGTLTIPVVGSAPVGSIVYKNVESVKIPQGYQLAFNVSSAGSAGAGYCMFKAFMSSEDPKNITAMVASA